MRDKTLKELRTIARRQGRSGYSGLRKNELLRLLARKKPKSARKRAKPRPEAKPARTRPVVSGSANRHAASRKRATATARPHTASATARKPSRAARGSATARTRKPADRTGAGRDRQARPVIMPASLDLPVPFVAADLGEDIESLPPLPDALLGLLPQKPGILHGYWALEPGTLRRRPDLRIRLCRIRDRVLDVLDEIPLPSDSGRWYFHVGDLAAETQLYAQLGYYGEGKAFITAIDRGIARLPSSRASAHTDTDWWISEEEFGQMYVRTGGRLDGQRLVWSASVSSR
ncbi:MAG: hypothetical protein ACYDHY_11475 [Acidiferrobacterales bacterium]